MYLGCARFQASAVKYMRSVLFWETAQRIVIIPYRRFGTIHRSQLRKSRNQRRKPLSSDFLTLEDKTDRLSRNVGKELTNTQCVIARKRADPMYFAAES
jgi:hypothetical protein